MPKKNVPLVDPREKAKRQGRRNKANGYRSEKNGEAELRRFGFHRVVLSGALPGEPGDLRRDIPDGKSLRLIENKRRQGALGYVEEWLAQEGATAVRVDPGGQRRPLVVLPVDQLALLLEEAGYALESVEVKSLPDLLRLAANRLETQQRE